MRGNGISLYADVLPKITGANRDGFRLVLPSCFRVPLADERVIGIIARADDAPDQASAGQFASRSIPSRSRVSEWQTQP